MRNLTSGNKMNFTIFAIIIIIILVILVLAISTVLRTEKEQYQVLSSASAYDNKYNYIELKNDGIISKKWTGNYYLKENVTKEQYDLGKYAVVYDRNRKSVDLFGTFYQVLEGGDISKITTHNTVNAQTEAKFYKIDDRKYLIVANSIENDTGSLSTENYLVIIIDKLGNALLLNNEINAKTINEMIISTEDYQFDVAKEILMFNNESINLKKIIGSTNEYVEPQIEEEVVEEIAGEETPSYSSSTTTTTTQNNSTTVVQNGNESQDLSWVENLNNWIQNVAAGFESIYNGNSGKKETGDLTKNITLNSLIADTTSLDINYTVTDPENKYNVVYAQVSDGLNTRSISLDKNSNTYKVTGLNPDTNYTVEMGYKVIYADSTTEEETEDAMTVRTKKVEESLTITKVTANKIYYNLKMDSNFVYEPGAQLVVYINNSAKYITINLTSAILERAASSGYTGSFDTPREYKTKNNSVTIQLENTQYEGNEIQTNLSAKIINY